MCFLFCRKTIWTFWPTQQQKQQCETKKHCLDAILKCQHSVHFQYEFQFFITFELVKVTQAERLLKKVIVSIKQKHTFINFYSFIHLHLFTQSLDKYCLCLQGNEQDEFPTPKCLQAREVTDMQMTNHYTRWREICISKSKVLWKNLQKQGKHLRDGDISFKP